MAAKGWHYMLVTLSSYQLVYILIHIYTLNITPPFSLAWWWIVESWLVSVSSTSPPYDKGWIQHLICPPKSTQLLVALWLKAPTVSWVVWPERDKVSKASEVVSQWGWWLPILDEIFQSVPSGMVAYLLLLQSMPCHVAPDWRNRAVKIEAIDVVCGKEGVLQYLRGA